MTTRTLTEVLSGFHFLEGPRWHDGKLVFSDFYSYGVYSAPVDRVPIPRESVTKLASVPHQPSGTGWLPDGRMLIVSQKDRRVLVRDLSGVVTEYADLSHLTEYPLNDMVVDSTGRAYVGSFGFDVMSLDKAKFADLYLVDLDRTAAVVAPELYAPNGLLITRNGSTLLVNETVGNRISAFDIAEDGRLGERRDWARFGPPPDLAPVPEMFGRIEIALDGCTLDSEGAVWTADAANQRVIRVREGAEITHEINFDMGAYACVLGGDDGQTLFTCVAPDFSSKRRKASAEARILSTRVDVPHAGLP